MKKALFLLALFSFFGTFYTKAQSAYNNYNSINKLIEKKKEFNKLHKSGYLIQLYNGLEEVAKKIRYRFQVEFPNIVPSVIRYKAPEWKVQVGNFKTRLQADRALNKINEIFPGAIVVPI
ncbi:MAG: SPOR domain-containing protein [Tenacibaculum sp.]